MIFDLHCDTIWQISQAKDKGEKLSLKKSYLQIDEEKLLQGNYLAQCFAIYIPNKYPDPFHRCLRDIEIYESEIGKSRVLAPVYRYSDFEKNAKEGKISAVLTMEDGCPIGDNLDNLYMFYQKGVRMICLLHNLENTIGSPNFGRRFSGGVSDTRIANTSTGLTEFGKALVKEMNKIGIVIDVSHLSDKGFYDVVKASNRPIVASHSNARAVCGHVRNLTDGMLYKLAENGGVLGVNFAKQFMHNNESLGRNTSECALRHIRYIKKKIGAEHIALGSDFDGINPNIELSNASKIHLLIQALEKGGFKSEEIEKITHKNALRVFKAIMLL